MLKDDKDKNAEESNVPAETVLSKAVAEVPVVEVPVVDVPVVDVPVVDVPIAVEPNVRLSKQSAELALPEGMVNIGMNPGIEIPSAEKQLSGFYLENPSVLINQFPQYKWIQKKGSERPVQ